MSVDILKAIGVFAVVLGGAWLAMATSLLTFMMFKRKGGLETVVEGLFYAIGAAVIWLCLAAFLLHP